MKRSGAVLKLSFEAEPNASQDKAMDIFLKVNHERLEQIPAEKHRREFELQMAQRAQQQAVGLHQRRSGSPSRT